MERDEADKYKIIDLFAGPGGIDVAAEKLGITTVGIEWDPSAGDTRDAAGLKTEKGDVRDYDPSRFPDANVLAGGPPCQTFTVAGNGAGRKALDTVLDFVERMAARENSEEIRRDLSQLDDERTSLILEPLRWALKAIDDGRPYEAIILEQVPGVLPVWEAYKGVLKKEGYSAECEVLRTEEYGVPQTRRRAILIARRGDTVDFPPPPTHRAYRRGVPRDEGDQNLKPWRTMAEVIDRKGPFEVISNYGTGGDPKARGRRRSCEPSATVTGKIFRNRIVAPDGTELERFSKFEAGRLQTFPGDYPWAGKDVGQQIGNATPPRLAMHVLCAALGWRPPDEKELKSLEKWKDEKASKLDKDKSEKPKMKK